MFHFSCVTILARERMKKKISFQILKWKALEGVRLEKLGYILGDEYEWMAGFHQSTCNAHPSKI